MPPEIAVIADDLTGAAEIAAIGLRFGRLSAVLTNLARAHHAAAIVACDTDSRLLTPAEAASRVRTLAQSDAIAHARSVFKKTDSLLRGCVRAELEALAIVRGQRRVLLLPANPQLGRVIVAGRYLIRGTPIHETSFAHDPHHPVTTDRVIEILGRDGELPVFARTLDDELPSEGIVIGDAQTDDELRAWATRVDALTLPAGSAAFFRAFLSQRGGSMQPVGSPPRVAGPVLVISGTTQPPPGSITSPGPRPEPIARFLPHAGWLDDCPPRSAGAEQQAWISSIARALAESGLAIVTTAELRSTAANSPSTLRHLLARLGRRLVESGACNHLIVEGGATAAAIVQALGWSSLAAVHEWDQGIVTLQARDSTVFLTTKPGSYPWPTALEQFLMGTSRVYGRRQD
jgi:uncharacterized protein YgbK (DUF1537 family)